MKFNYPCFGIMKKIYYVKSKLYEYEFQLKIYFEDKICGVYVYKNRDSKGNKYIEFMTIIKDDFTESEVNLLKRIHNKLKFNKKIKGRYVRLKDIGKTDLKMETYNCLENNELKKEYTNIDYFTWWLFKNKGIGVRSPAINKLSSEIG